MPVLNLPVLLSCVNACVNESFLVIIADVLYRSFHKQSMVQSEVRELCVHPTWFICNEDFIVNVLQNMKLTLITTIQMCDLYTSLNDFVN